MDNFENQDLGGLPILKKETPSQEKDLGGLPILKKKEPTPSGFSVTPLPSQDKFQEGLAMAQSPIASAVKKDTQKDENLSAGIYNTLVGSVKRLAGGAAYAGEVFLGGRPEATITRLASAENARQKTEQFVEKARSEKASKQYEESMGKYDFTPKPGGGLLSGVDANDFKALAFTAPSQALDMVLGSLTYGSSFVAQSISDAANEINQSDSGKKLNEAQKATYIFTQAAVQAALEKVSLDLILKNTGLGKAAKQKIANEITDEFVKKGIKATAKDIEEAAFKKASTFANQAKRVGIKAVAGLGTEGTTEGTQTAAQEGIKLLTNKIVDKDVFNEEDIIANLGKNIINASIGGAAFGSVAGGGVGVFQNTNKAIRDEVAKAGKKYFVNDTEVSEAEFNAATGNKKVVSDITKIQDEISKQVEEGNITPQEAQAANITAQQYAEIAGKIPTTVSPQDKYKIIGGIEQREALNARKQQAYDELTTLDPVFRKEKQDQIDLIQAKIDETNDYLEGIVSGKKPEYKEKRGMYFKVDSEGNETPINKETYDLAKSIREEDERKAKEPVDTTPAVIMPEENLPPQVVEPSKGASVIMPEENVPAETTVISPEQQGKGAAVIMPEANVAPEVAETVVTEEVAPTEVKPEVKSKLESFKTKFAPQPKEVSVSGVTAAQKRVNRQEAAKIAPTDARGFALSWMNQSPDALDWNSIKDLFGGRRARLNVKEVTPEEIAKRDYVAEKEGDEKVGKNGLVKGIDEVVGDIWNNLPEGLEDRITTRDIKDELEALISEYPTRADAARALIQHEGGLKGKSMEEQQLAFEERKGIEEGEEMAPVELEGGFVPFEEDMDIEGMEEPPFAVQEATTEEVAAMQDIVKDYIDDGTTSLSEIKKAIAKELGYNTKKLRQTIEDAFNEYTKTQEAAPKDVVGGVVGRIGNALKKMFGKDAQKPFIAKDSKAMQAKLDEIREDVKFQIAGGFRSTNDMPIAYRYDTDQVARERYDIPKLKKIGEGSDRVVFDLKDGNVLKIAKTPRGLEQNIYEGDYYLAGSVLPDIIERGVNYIVVEKVDQAISRTIDLGIAEINIELDKKEIGKLNDLLKQLKQFTQKDFDNHDPKLQQILEDNDLTDIMNYDVIWNDFTAKRNWGLKKGEPIHLDGGTFGGIQMLDRFKGEKPLSDPEFRDIYNRSKKAKIENKDVDKFTKFMAIPKQNLAPNGKPSNLTPQQYEQVRTNKFKDWFGDWENDPENSSKVVDENGEPLVVYHGSVAPDIEFFDRSLSKRESSGLKEMGFYFTTNKKLAEAYMEKATPKEGVQGADGKIYESFLNLRKVKEFDAEGKSGLRAWDNLQVDAGYKIAQNRDAMDFLMNGKFGVEKVDGIIANNIVDIELYGFKGQQLKDEFKGTVYLVFDDKANSIKSATENIGDFSKVDNRIKFMSDVDILGFTYNNKMYLNGEKLNPNTPIHEAGHIWVEWTKTNDPKIYAKGMELVEGSPYLKKVKDSKFYQQQAENMTDSEKADYFKNEALAMAIGDKGAQFVVESKKDAFKDWLKTLWNKIKSLTGFKDLTEEQFQNLTFEEFSKMAVKEILGVENDLDKFQAVRSMKKKKDFVKGKVRGEANKRAIDDFEVDDMVKLIKADYDLQTLKNIKDAIQKRSAEEVLPSQPRKTREARGERKRVEPRVEGDEATGEGEDAQPEGIEKDWEGAITIAANEERRQMLGLPEYQRERESFEQWTNDAIKAIKRGYNVDKLLDKMQKGYVPTPAENQIRKIYVAKLKSDYDKNPSTELEKKLIKYTQLNDIANSQAGRTLRSLADVADPRETLADFVISKMEANNVDELTEKQRGQVKKQYEEVKKKEEDVEAKLEINDELNTQLLAENAFKEEKAKRKPYQKTKDYKADRKSIIESIKQKWKDKDKPSDVLMALPFPVPTKKAQQLVAIAPDVSKLMSSYLEEGVDDLKEIVSRIYVDLRNEIDGLSEKDIFDVIAGRYKKEKPLLSQLQFKKAELKKEAELIAKIEDIMAGNMPTSEKAKIEQNQKLTQLRNELRDLKKEIGFYDLSKINSLKEKNLEKIKELDEKIQKGDFEKAIRTPSFLENPEFKKKYPKEYDAYLQSVKELTDKKHEFEVSLAKDELKGLTFRQKLVKRWGPEFKNTLSAIKATADNSFIFIQLGPAIWQNPLLLPKVLNEQRKVIFNEGRFRKEIVQIFENKELANLIEVSGLDILDPQTLRESLREEQLGGTDFLERSVEIKGKKYSLATVIKAPFERIAIAAGNYVRLKLFLESVSHLEAQGKTIETHEKEFKDAARIANELTSRGEMSEEFKTGKLKTLSSLMWAPKMISSTLNLLGIGDAYNYALGRKGYYASLSPELRKVAISKMATAITVPYLIMAAIALDDDFEVDYDPRSVTFGQLKQISTGESWNPYGRFTSVVRYLILMMLGVRYIADEKMRADFKTETFKFFRGKMAPAYGLGLDLAFREGFDGQPLSFNDVAKDAVTPLALKDLKTYMEDDGTWGLITKGLPAITGIKVGTEKQFNQAKQPLEDVIKKHARTDDTYYSFELKNPTTKEIATKEQFDKFVKERDRLIAEKLTDLYNGYVITDSPNPVPFVSLEANEASKQISTAKTESTKEAKEIVFGKKKKSAMERLIERKRRMLRR